MIAVTATIKSSVLVLRLLEQCRRRHFTTLGTCDDSIVVAMPELGRILHHASTLASSSNRR
jgi:hypothetical protein